MPYNSPSWSPGLRRPTPDAQSPCRSSPATACRITSQARATSLLVAKCATADDSPTPRIARTTHSGARDTKAPPPLKLPLSLSASWRPKSGLQAPRGIGVDFSVSRGSERQEPVAAGVLTSGSSPLGRRGYDCRSGCQPSQRSASGAGYRRLYGCWTCVKREVCAAAPCRGSATGPSK